MINTNELKLLREKTGASIVDCKKALEELGDFDKALKKLMAAGKGKAVKKADRTAGETIIESYIHSNKKIGVLLEISCETDFVANNEEFKDLAHNIAMHIAASNPIYLSRTDIAAEKLEEEKKKYAEELKKEGKPEKMIDKIVEGKINKWYENICLLDQAYIKDQDITVKDLKDRAVTKLGENIVIKRFARFEAQSGSSCMP